MFISFQYSNSDKFKLKKSFYTALKYNNKTLRVNWNIRMYIGSGYWAGRIIKRCVYYKYYKLHNEDFLQ